MKKQLTLAAILLISSIAAFGQGSITPCKINNIRIVDSANSCSWSGTTLDAWISAAISDLPTSGGTIDARGLGATSQTWAAPVTIGSLTKGVTIMFDRMTKITFTSTGGGCQIKLEGGSALLGEGYNQPLSGQGAGWFVSNGASVSNIICLDNQSAGAGFTIQGITINGNSSPTISDAIVSLSSPTEMGFVWGLVIGGFSNTTLLKITQGGTGFSVSGTTIFQPYINCESVTGCHPVKLVGVDGSGSWGGLNFFGGSFDHPGSGGIPIVDCEGNASMNTAGGVTFYGPYLESSSSSDIGFLVNNCHGVRIHDPFFSATTAGADCVKLSGTVDGFEITSADNFNGWTNNIHNTINGRTLASSNGNRFSYHYYRGSVTNTDVWDDSSGNNGHIDSSGVCGHTSCN